MCGSDGGPGGRTPSLENHKSIGFLGKTGPDPMKNHKATKPAFNVGPSSVRQRNGISMALRWWVDNSPLLVFLDPLAPYQLKTVVRAEPPRQKNLGPRME